MNDTRDPRTEKLARFEQFIDQYYPSIFAGVQKLTGPAGKMAIEKLTVEIFVDLWENSDELFAPQRKPAFVYKVLVNHVVAFLKKTGNEEQLRLLQYTLLIDPANLPGQKFALLGGGDLPEKFLDDKTGSEPGGHL